MIHATAIVQTKAIGAQTDVWQFVVILPSARIGNHCNINAHCFIENDVVVGDNVTVKCGVYLWDGIVIENNVQIGPNVTFTNDRYPRAKKAFTLGRTQIKTGVSIGANATILGGRIIGAYAMIGAGSVLTKDVPDNTLWYGNPARQVGFVCNCGQKLPASRKCAACGQTLTGEKKTLRK
jgi:acetyltransferase-like isoleucine patch superfamily enzyme